jgi:hypothetical protein
MYEENMLYFDTCYEIILEHGFKTDDFIIFKYCPWCGKKLVKIPLSNTMSLHETQKRSYLLHSYMPLPVEMWNYFFMESV